jgi:Icc-related predicted phosphoesterase
VIRRLTIGWPNPLHAGADGGRPVRLLAVSDQVERAFDFEPNRTSLGSIDGVLGCGDLEPDYLSFLADAFRVPLLYVRGNHDRGGGWEAGRRTLPGALDGRVARLAGIAVGGLSWPWEVNGKPLRDDRAAWRQSIGFRLRTWLGPAPQIMVSHVPPLGLGDTLEDPYHRGFRAYHWLCSSVHPVLWLHGHTSMAASPSWHVEWGGTTLVNVTGAVLVELMPLT